MKYIYATRVVDASADVVNVEALLHKQPLQIDLCETDVCKMQSGSHVILDFGKEVSGGARILAFQGTRVPVRLRFGESVSETCSEIRETPDEPKTSTNDHSLRDFRVELQEFSDMTFGQTGFRFLRIDVEGEGKTLELKSVLAAVTNDTRRAKGSFECDDPLVNQIWETAAYTLRLCIQNGYIWDGVKRDRLVWIGDLYPEIRAAACVFGEIPEGLRSLEFSMKQAPLPQYINRMPTYSLWWLICLCESYRMSGDKNKYNAYLSYAKGVVEQVIAPAVAEDGTVSYCFNYIDWPSCAQEGEDKTEERNKERLAGVSYLTQVALNGVKEFLSQFGENTDLCDELLTKIKQKSYEIHLYKQIAALGVWAGDCSESIKNTLLSNGGKGLSTFQSYPILTAVAKFGAYEEALSMMKEYYG
ncbi:MAG: hypothetical protein IKZ28_03400, partial [Clostridia bacterium]|nr:hypothetical protein [Clostridia bacterium]